MPNYYAVAKGRNPGVYNTWDECKIQVDGFPKARYKKFDTKQKAKNFIEEHSTSNSGGAKVVVKQKFVQTKFVEKRNFSATGSETSDVVKAKLARIEVDSSTVVIYTDGACSSNGRSGAKAGVGVFFGDNHVDNVSEPLTSGPQTNNRAEYTAVLRALEVSSRRQYESVQIRTDSRLLVNSMNDWMPKWKRNGWVTATGGEVKNRDLLEKIDDLRSGVKAEFVHVNGHAGIYGNEKADELARGGVNMHRKG